MVKTAEEASKGLKTKEQQFAHLITSTEQATAIANEINQFVSESFALANNIYFSRRAPEAQFIAIDQFHGNLVAEVDIKETAGFVPYRFKDAPQAGEAPKPLPLVVGGNSSAHGAADTHDGDSDDDSGKKSHGRLKRARSIAFR